MSVEDDTDGSISSAPTRQPGDTFAALYTTISTPLDGLIATQTTGCLGLTFDNAPPIGSEQRGILMLVARYAGHALERLRLLEDNVEARTRAELLHGLARAVISAQHVEQVYEAAIGDHVAAATARFETMEELQRTVRFNEMFAGMLGHDLRNPLGAIMTTAQLLVLKSEHDTEIVRPVTRILSSGTRMSRMIDQLLDFTRVRVGAGIPLQRRNLDLTPLLHQVVEEIEMAHPDAMLHVQHAGNSTGYWDEDRLSQVFSNLLANGVHHGLGGQPVTARIDGRSNDPVRIEIHSHGAIPKDVRPKLFEPIAGGERRWGNSEGLGLGLFIARQIVRAHGGTIEGRSADDQTTFTVTLPRDGAIP